MSDFQHWYMIQKSVSKNLSHFVSELFFLFFRGEDKNQSKLSVYLFFSQNFYSRSILYIYRKDIHLTKEISISFVSTSSLLTPKVARVIQDWYYFSLEINFNFVYVVNFDLDLSSCYAERLLIFKIFVSWS